MGIGKSTDRGSSRPTATSRAPRHEGTHGDRATPTALTEGGSAIDKLTGYVGALNLSESPGECFVKMTPVEIKRPNIFQFTFRGVDRHSRLANETTPFLLRAVCGIEAELSADGEIIAKGRKDELRDRDPDLVCRVINHLRQSGLKDDEIVLLMNGTSFSKHLSAGHLRFEGSETVHLILGERPKTAVRIVQEAVQDLCYWGAYDLASELLDSDAVQNLPPKALWFDGDHCLRSTGWMLSTRLTDAGLDVPVDCEERYDRQFLPLKRLFGMALDARQGTAGEPEPDQLDIGPLVESPSEWLAESTSESLVESTSESLNSSGPLVISEDD